MLILQLRHVDAIFPLSGVWILAGNGAMGSRVDREATRRLRIGGILWAKWTNLVTVGVWRKSNHGVSLLIRLFCYWHLWCMHRGAADAYTQWGGIDVGWDGCQCLLLIGNATPNSAIDDVSASL